MDKASTKIIILREGVLQSWAKDAVTLGGLMALPWFNHNYGGGSAWIYAAIAILWIIGLPAKIFRLAGDNQKTPDEARAWLDEHYPASRAPVSPPPEDNNK